MADDTLAKEIFTEQKEKQFPGLVRECETIAKELKILSDLENEKVGRQEFKNTVKKAIEKKNEEILRSEISQYSKLKHWEGDDYTRKDYLTELSLEEARLKFRIRCNMAEFAFNFRNKPKYANNNWSCSSCHQAIDTFSHAKWCPTNADLREGRNLDNDKDLVWYITQVLKRRENSDR